MTLDDAYREALIEQMKTQLVLLTWTNFSRDFRRAVDQATATPHVPMPVPHLAPADLFRLRDIACSRTLCPAYFKKEPNVALRTLTLAKRPYMVGLCSVSYAPVADAVARITQGDAINFQNQTSMRRLFLPPDTRSHHSAACASPSGAGTMAAALRLLWCSRATKV